MLFVIELSLMPRRRPAIDSRAPLPLFVGDYFDMSRRFEHYERWRLLGATASPTFERNFDDNIISIMFIPIALF